MNGPVAVVLDFRTPARTLDCLQSLAAEGIRRVVLVENSEDDGTSLRAMQAGLDDLRALEVAIDVLDGGLNLGFAAGVNRALAHIRQQDVANILLLNSDARLMPGCLGEMAAALRSGADFAVPMLIGPTGERLCPVRHYQRHTAIVSRYALPGATAYATGACMLLSAAIAESDLFDEDFFFYGEDVAMSATLRASGGRWAVAKRGEVMHEGSGSARNGSLFYEYHINRGHLLLARKLTKPGFGRRAAVLGRCIFLPLRALVRSAKARTTVPLQGLCMALVDCANGRIKAMTPTSIKKPGAVE